MIYATHRETGGNICKGKNTDDGNNKPIIPFRNDPEAVAEESLDVDTNAGNLLDMRPGT